jgi:SAM-dependent methyltransferase
MSESKENTVQSGSKQLRSCKICGNGVANRIHIAREMMFGLGETFAYLECGECGCLQLLEVPKDMARYYPNDYYSFQKHGVLMTALRRRWSAYAFGAKSLFGWLFSQIYFENRAMMAVRHLGNSPKSRILDVGCGAGHLLLDLKHLGFQNLSGADAFIEHDLNYVGGPVIYKKHLDEMSGVYDLIMLHHSFEHMDAPLQNLRSITRLLATDGTVIIRIPIASSDGWRRFGVNWVQLDAPRHFFLHTYRSIEFLCNQAGLFVSEVIQESDDGTFWASEAYERNIPMNDRRFPNRTVLKRLLGWRQTQRYRALAREINQRREADLVCFYLRKRNLPT